MRTTTRLLAAAALACLLATGLGPVRADAPPGHFTDNGDGTIRDNVTLLTWQQAQTPTPVNQPGAVAYCAALPLAGGGWRLPSLYELQSILDDRRQNPSFDPRFIGMSFGYLWSSTPVPNRANEFWAMYVDGNSVETAIGITQFARCVR